MYWMVSKILLYSLLCCHSLKVDVMMVWITCTVHVLCCCVFLIEHAGGRYCLKTWSLSLSLSLSLFHSLKDASCQTYAAVYLCTTTLAHTFCGPFYHWYYQNLPTYCSTEQYQCFCLAVQNTHLNYSPAAIADKWFHVGMHACVCTSLEDSYCLEYRIWLI